MNELAYSWPETCLHGALNREVPHAIGVISINWVFVELAQEQLIHHYLATDADRARLLTTHLSSYATSELLKGLADLLEAEPRFVEAVDRFLACLETAKHNRNVVMHSLCVPGPEGTTLTSRTARGRVRVYDTVVNEQVLARIGRESRELFHFGINLWECLRGRETGRRIGSPHLIDIPQRLAPVERSTR